MSEPKPKWPTVAASLSIACAIAAVLMPTISRALYDPADPGNDNAFSALTMMPALLVGGLALAFFARRAAGQPHQLARIALWLNLGLLVALIALVGWGIGSYQGR